MKASSVRFYPQEKKDIEGAEGAEGEQLTYLNRYASASVREDGAYAAG